MIIVVGSREDIDAEALGNALGIDIEDGSYWTVQATDEPACHTHVEVNEATRVRDEDEADAGTLEKGWMIRMSTYRGASAHDDKPLCNMGAMLQALGEAITAEEVSAFVSTALAFPAESSEWRPSLLANPPEMKELRDALGRIVVSGLILRFEGSPQGLVRAELDVTPSRKSLTTDLQFGVELKTNRASDLYEIVLDKAERFASLFIEFQLPHGVGEEE